MATKKKEIKEVKATAPDIEGLFVQKAPRGNFGKKVYKLLVENCGTDFLMGVTLDKLLSIPGLGRKGALLAVEVAADLAGKK